MKQHLNSPKRNRTETPGTRRRVEHMLLKKHKNRIQERQRSLPPESPVFLPLSRRGNRFSAPRGNSMQIRSSSVENESCYSLTSNLFGTPDSNPKPKSFCNVDCLTFLQSHNKRPPFRWSSRRGYSVCMDCFDVLKTRIDPNGEDAMEHINEAADVCRFLNSNIDRMHPLRKKWGGGSASAEQAFDDSMYRRTKFMCAEEHDAWFPEQSTEKMTPTQGDIDAAKYSLPFVVRTMQQIVEIEKTLMENLDSAMIQHKAIPKMTRESCDVCRTSIFNFHWLCKYCAFTVCGRCVQEREEKEKAILATGTCWQVQNTEPGDESKKVSFIPRDSFSWFHCCSNTKYDLSDLIGKYTPKSDHDFHPAVTIPIHAFCSMEIRIVEISCGGYFNKSILPVPFDAKSTKFPSGLLYFYEPPLDDDFDSLCHFRKTWIEREPIVVTRVDGSLSDDLWRPETFVEKFGDQEVMLVDCLGKPQIELKGLKHHHFWDGFENFDGRIVNEKGEHRLLKIKDWPQFASFGEILPEHFQELMLALPFNKYTNVKGSLNMVRYLPDFFNPPDLGPKMYIAYGSAGQPLFGTTNLHVDVSDAVNVIVYVGRPTGTGADQVIKAAKEELERLNLEGHIESAMIDRVRSNELPGALWQIYKPKDVPAIRKFIRNLWNERGWFDKKEDPIHAQIEYLDFELRKRLKEEHQVQAFDIIQFEGDAIFIPAGAPHQVWNIHSCIKIAEDFVSPENLHYCLELTEQFRQLPDDFANKPDKLQYHLSLISCLNPQIKSMIFHAAKAFMHITESIS